MVCIWTNTNIIYLDKQMYLHQHGRYLCVFGPIQMVYIRSNTIGVQLDQHRWYIFGPLQLVCTWTKTAGFYLDQNKLYLFGQTQFKCFRTSTVGVF